MKRSIWAATLVAAAACGGGGAVGTGEGPVETGQPVFTALSVSPQQGSVEVGGSFQLSALPMDAAGRPMNGLPAPAWSTGDPARARVDGTGRVTGVSAGPVTISAALTAGGVTRTASAQLTVVAPTPTQTYASLEVNPPAAIVSVGGSATLTAIPRDGSGAAIPNLPAASWSSGSPAVASVSGAGVVTGVGAGTAIVTATLTAGGVTRTATSAVTVPTPPGTGTGTAPNAATVRGIGHSFSPSTVTIATGGTVTWMMVDEEHDVTWQGATPPGGDIPKMDEDESASRTFPVAGTYTYRCVRHESHVETGTVIVQTPGTGGGGGATPVLTLVTVSPAAPAATVGGTVQLTATPRDQAGAAMAGVSAPAWTSSAPGVATVSASGVVTGVSAGTSVVTATHTHAGSTRSGSVTVTISATGTGGGGTGGTSPGTATVTTPGDTFSPANVTIAVGGTVSWRISGGRHNVRFTGTVVPAGGHIPDTENATVSRTFSAAGSYPYACTRHSGMSGTVTVR